MIGYRRVRCAEDLTDVVPVKGSPGELLAETIYSSVNQKLAEREYIWLDSLPLAFAERTFDPATGMVIASQLAYLHPDHLGTPRLATDPAQRMVWHWSSDAFGIGGAQNDPDGDTIETEVGIRLPGQYFDSESGLHYNYFRDYDPAIGRYVESDPIGLEGGINTYAYALQDPIRWYDEAGLASTLSQVACRQAGIPTQAERCVDQAECFKRAQNGLYRCQAMSSAFRKFLCTRCWEAYTSTCPGKEKDPSCDRQACVAPAPADRRVAL